MGASGRFAQNGTQGKEGVVGGLRPVLVKGVEILGGPGRFPQNVDPSRWSGRVKGTPGGRGTLKKKPSQVGKDWQGVGRSVGCSIPGSFSRSGPTDLGGRIRLEGTVGKLRKII